MNKVLSIFIVPNSLVLLLIAVASIFAANTSLSIFGIPVSTFDFSTKANATTLSTSLNQVALLPTVSTSSSSLLLQNFTVAWPTQNQPDANLHTFEGKIGTVSESQYLMFWQVGGGVYTRMTPKQSGANSVFASINFSSWKWLGDGPYELSFIVQDRSGKELFRKKIAIKRYTVNGQTIMSLAGSQPTTATPTTSAPAPTTSTPAPAPIAIVATTTNTTPTPITTPTAGKRFAGKTLYLHPNQATVQKQIFDANNNTTQSALINVIAKQPQAVWLTRGNDQDLQLVRDIMAKTTTTAIPTFVIYAIPNRDCNSYSRGGLGNGTLYLDWIKKLAETVSTKPSIIIFEPDALPQISCLTASDQTTRLALMKESLRVLGSKSATAVYLDIGHPFWLSPTVAVDRLQKAGISYVRGFSLNVSNFFTNAENITYGEQISAKLNGMPYVIDSSRNGKGATLTKEWCNPAGRALGTTPQFVTTHPRVDAYLWIKHPGESDGTCNGGPRAGAWWLENALSYVRETQRLTN
ncbi:MAG: glycoside hydrolase family 6 protein [Patescibacteria group bacterium]